MSLTREARFLAVLTVLAALRLLAGALLPLSADEAYYWLWSRHLAAGYFDHPPAVAFVIRAGTLVFGATAFGVRIGGILLSFAASWFVWRTGAILSRDEKVGAYACLFFNLTLMITVEMLAATPDTPSIFTSAVYFWTLAKVVENKDGRWWLAVGVAAGLGLLSKYSAFFLGLGTLAWLVSSPPMRRWLLSPWPYLGAVLSLLLFAPNLWWNATHGWGTLAFQFGRIEAEAFTLRYLLGFLGAQLLLASPFLLVLGVLGATTRWHDERYAMVAALIWPPVAYFAFHSLHANVQGNWPCFLYPLLSMAAATAWQRTDWSGWRAPVVHWSKRLAIPVAAVLLTIAYAQALFGVVPMGRKDPLARLLAVGFPEVVAKVEALRMSAHADAILTTDYASTAWFTFYGPGPVVAVGQDYRWANDPAADPALFAHPVLYVSEIRRDDSALIAAHFAHVTEIARIDRKREGVPIAHYVVYRVSGLKGAAVGHIP
ncbi:MAG: glycosyltransferase family 39 protein [Alphaproteobacteria bacterium]|nr:glycosyltransferase family 39 protein [Alphaproteobacteria bacterium]MDE2164336.1 glycosyltransferase family 39 protein [Alphaproteobacteria bacterium]